MSFESDSKNAHLFEGDTVEGDNQSGFAESEVADDVCNIYFHTHSLQYSFLLFPLYYHECFIADQYNYIYF